MHVGGQSTTTIVEIYIMQRRIKYQTAGIHITLSRGNMQSTVPPTSFIVGIGSPESDATE
jgi:hypothetical protein